jgi:hypothetical protein
MRHLADIVTAVSMDKVADSDVKSSSSSVSSVASADENDIHCAHVGDSFSKEYDTETLDSEHDFFPLSGPIGCAAAQQSSVEGTGDDLGYEIKYYRR